MASQRVANTIAHASTAVRLALSKEIVTNTDVLLQLGVVPWFLAKWVTPALSSLTILYPTSRSGMTDSSYTAGKPSP